MPCNHLTVIIRIKMNKQSSIFRRCQYCPHRPNKKPCCCQNRRSVHSVKTKPNKSKCDKKTKQMDTSAISYINTTMPITANQFNSHMSLSNNILAQNSILRTENDYLKRQLHGQYHNVSAFTKDDRNISTLPTSENDTSRTFHLHDKLYASNRNLQEALIELDSLSRSNKDLHEVNTKLQLQKQQLRITNEEIYQESQRLKKKIKKLNKAIESLPNETDVQKILQVNSQLEKQNNHMRAEIEDLKEELRRKQSRSRTIVEIQNLSPEWVAHTSTKINALEKNISKLQEQQKQNIVANYGNSSGFYEKERQIQMDPSLIGLRQQLVATIKSLKIQSQTFRLGSGTFTEFLNGNNSTFMFLIKTLCESLLEPILIKYSQMQKSIEKAIKIYQNKLEKVVRRMENVILKVQNDKLRSIKQGAHF